MNISELSFSDTTEEFNFEGLDANLDIAADLSARFSLEMGELAAINNIDNSNVLVAGMTITSSTAQLNDILAESRAMLSIPSISSTLPLPFSMSDIGITNDLQASATMEGFSEIYQEIHIANIESEVPVSSFSWLVEIKQLNNELVRDYYRLLSELQNEMSSDADALSAELDELTQELYLLVLQNPLELNNRIEANSYVGDHTADLRVLWAGLSTLNDPEELDVTEAIAALSMTLDISLDLEAILRSPLAELVDPYVQQGYLNIANGRVMVEASLQQSVLRVNGEEISLDQFF